jgi:Reverse transcriptase (RNA-dependent DNA polymerase)
MHEVTDQEIHRAYAHVRGNMTRRARARTTKRPIPLGGLRDALNSERYVPGALKSGRIPKDDGTMRDLLIPSVYDRIVGCIALKRLAPIFDTFPTSIVGFMPEIGVQVAVLETAAHLRNNPGSYIFKFDVKDFFPSCDHRLALEELARLDPDPVAFDILTRQYARWGAEHGGVPQGCPASPVLSNIILKIMDEELAAIPCLFYRRYADDGIIITEDESTLMKAVGILHECLLARGLQLHSRKSHVVRDRSFKFLGISIRRDGQLAIPPEAWKRLETMKTREQRRGWHAHYCFVPRWKRFLREERGTSNIVKGVTLTRTAYAVTVERTLRDTRGASGSADHGCKAAQAVGDVNSFSSLLCNSMEWDSFCPRNINGKTTRGC